MDSMQIDEQLGILNLLRDNNEARTGGRGGGRERHL